VARFNGTMATQLQIFSVASNSDGTYTVIFTTAATWDGTTEDEPGLVFIDGEDGITSTPQYRSQVDASTILFADPAANTNDKWLVSTGFLLGITQTHTSPIAINTAAIESP
jgi:hypothetical protein